MTTSTKSAVRSASSSFVKTTLIQERNNWRKTRIKELYQTICNGEDPKAGILTMSAPKPTDFGFSLRDLKFFDSFYSQKESNVQRKISEVNSDIGKINARIGDGTGVNKKVQDQKRGPHIVLASLGKKRTQLSKMREILNNEIIRRTIRLSPKIVKERQGNKKSPVFLLTGGD